MDLAGLTSILSAPFSSASMALDSDGTTPAWCRMAQAVVLDSASGVRYRRAFNATIVSFGNRGVSSLPSMPVSRHLIKCCGGCIIPLNITSYVALRNILCHSC